MNVKVFSRLLAEMAQMPVDWSEVSTSDDLVYTLGIDSVGIFELLILTEAMATCYIPPLDVPFVRSFDDLFDYYNICREVE